MIDDVSHYFSNFCGDHKRKYILGSSSMTSFPPSSDFWVMMIAKLIFSSAIPPLYPTYHHWPFYTMSHEVSNLMCYNIQNHICYFLHHATTANIAISFIFTKCLLLRRIFRILIPKLYPH